MNESKLFIRNFSDKKLKKYEQNVNIKYNSQRIHKCNWLGNKKSSNSLSLLLLNFQ